MGHQHYPHSFYKLNSTGERVLYVEAPALQDEKYPKTSAFRVMVFEFDTQQEKSVEFRRQKGIYRRVDESDWRPLTINRSVRAEFRLSEDFQSALNETGTPFIHNLKGPIKLRDIFVFPELLVRGAGAKPTIREVRGEEVLTYTSSAKRAIFQAPDLGGKTALAKMIVWEMARRGTGVPVLLNGRQVTTPLEKRVLAELWKAFSSQYSQEMLEEFKQTPKLRVLIIDDWHRTQLNPDGRRAFLELAGKYFERIFLFTDELFQLQELISNSPDTMLHFDQVTIREFRHGLRGELIDRWITLGREYTADPRKIAREIEEKERVIKSVMGKNTLPSVPFILLCLLQADQENKAHSQEAGSFGYLYEVLVTVALSTTKGPKAQLEKKYTFLARLAYEMFKTHSRNMSHARVREIANEYSQLFRVRVDVDSMLSDLEEARVLLSVDGNYMFAYSHLFYYFIARYYRDNLDREPALHAEIEHMIDHVLSEEYAAILMFVVYFARSSTAIVEKLARNADKIYVNESPADLVSDVAFLNRLCEQPELQIPEVVDLAKSRQERREFLDRMEENAQTILNDRKRDFVYSEDLSDKDKFDLGYIHIALLGQVIRNFPGSLPGPEKLAILKSTYLLGLRLLRALFRMLESTVGQYREGVATALVGTISAEKIRKLADTLVVLISRICTLSVLKKVSGSVGIADLEDAYREAIEIVGRNNATELIDLSIKLDHFEQFPESQIRQLHKTFMTNPFADTILADLVTAHILMFDVDRRTRQSMAALFDFKANAPMLIDPKRKK